MQTPHRACRSAARSRTKPRPSQGARSARPRWYRIPWGDAFYVRRENLNNTQILRAKIYKYIVSKKYSNEDNLQNIWMSMINIDQNIHHIGKIVEGNEVLVVDLEGRQLDFNKDGWDSFK